MMPVAQETTAQCCHSASFAGVVAKPEPVIADWHRELT